MSNAERQRRFQEAHPGYDRRRKARRRAGLERSVEKKKVEWRAAAMAEQAAAAAAAEQTTTSHEPAEVVSAPRMFLSPPARAVMPVLRGLNVITPAPERVAERIAA